MKSEKSPQSGNNSGGGLEVEFQAFSAKIRDMVSAHEAENAKLREQLAKSQADHATIKKKFDTMKTLFA